MGRKIPGAALAVATSIIVCVFQLWNDRSSIRLLTLSSMDKIHGRPSTVAVITLPLSLEEATVKDINQRDTGYYYDDVYSLSTETKKSKFLEQKIVEEDRKHKRKRKDPPDNDNPPKIVLSHVWSPHVVRQTENMLDNPYYPLDQAQNVTWGSMWRAKEYYQRQNPGRNLTIYCAVLWIDVEVLQKHQPPLCQKENTVVLERSSHTEYPDLSPPIHYPFINDILLKSGDAMDRYSTRRKNKSSSKTKYMVYTNADTGIVQNFYTTLEKAILTQPSLHEAFQINRRTIAREYQGVGEIEPHPLTSNDLELIEDEIIEQYVYHPGIDCFVMRKDIMDGFDLGNMFLGQPPWAGVVKTILKDFMSVNYGEYSSKARLTFLLGNDHELNVGGQNLTGTAKLQALKPCLFSNNPSHGLWTDHRYRNTLNCAIISNGTLDFVEKNGPFPPFMKPNAYDQAMKVYHVRERERTIASLQREKERTIASLQRERDARWNNNRR
jgi:uncharacterized small protein (DUF1192 family)